MPRQAKLPPEQKSKVIAFRLDPKSADGAWALDIINTWQQNNPGIDLRELFMRALEAHVGQARVKSEVKIKAADIRQMMKMIQQINERIQSGQWVSSATGQNASSDDPDFSEGIQAIFDHYSSMPGLTGDDED